MLVPLLHPPGEAQVDFPCSQTKTCLWAPRTFHPTNEDLFVGTPEFGEALVIIAGLK